MTALAQATAELVCRRIQTSRSKHKVPTWDLVPGCGWLRASSIFFRCWSASPHHQLLAVGGAYAELWKTYTSYADYLVAAAVPETEDKQDEGCSVSASGPARSR